MHVMVIEKVSSNILITFIFLSDLIFQVFSILDEVNNNPRLHLLQRNDMSDKLIEQQ